MGEIALKVQCGDIRTVRGGVGQHASWIRKGVLDLGSMKLGLFQSETGARWKGGEGSGGLESVDWRHHPYGR